jgi:hypothetical protein
MPKQKGDTTGGATLCARLPTNSRRYPVSLRGPRLHLIHACHSSSINLSVTCGVVRERSKTRTFLSSHSVRMTSMMSELAVLRSAAANLAIAAGHHSPISTFSDGYCGISLNLVHVSLMTSLDFHVFFVYFYICKWIPLLLYTFL